MTKRSTSRRQFLQTSSAVGASLLITGTHASGQVKGANERVRMAIVGVNSRGKAHIDGFGRRDDVEIACIVDPDQNVLSQRMSHVDKATGGKHKCRTETDIRKVLEDPSIDAISIATPNHWHSLMTIWAAQHGKHVYVEKPMSHDIAEGRVVVEAQKKHKVVIQHGTQRRSDAGIAGLHEALHNGTLPRLKIAYGYACKPRRGIGFKDPKSPPSNLDWTLWKGPAVLDAYHENLVHYNWHWFWKTGNGELNNQGTHQLDVARWALDPDQTHPARAMAIGGRFGWDDQGETPNTMFGVAEYPNGQYMMFNVRNWEHENYKTKVTNEYYLEDGSVIVGEGRYKIKRPGSDKFESLSLPRGKVTPGGNWASFITAIKANDPTLVNGGVEDAHYSCVVGHIINDSYRLGEEVPFNEKAVKFGDNADAAEHFLKLHEMMKKDGGLTDSANYNVGPWLEFDATKEVFVGDRADEANILLKDPTNPGFEVPSVSEV
ncbi:Gfo/Idh/MocA family oxidoreductase [Aeoliella sp. ICT_H6.2]|uniref:Gfo/Idh/MocA family oxidoreductase n=1 Tax=Aeoliella straminimaris TaxID=2954799 RepID=A0A9X2F9G4_9BACT|nr:Gfo/Idh/MocA family oxidoreductase [Aeoliella straminimaris]MCO6044840.1 Gfo/Idh/MocA family oxidoreductase [Aeoliella straminimaris]